MGGQRHAPAALPPGKTQHPLYRRLGGPHGRSGRCGKSSPPPAFDPRTVQPVAIRCTHWATPAPALSRVLLKIGNERRLNAAQLSLDGAGLVIYSGCTVGWPSGYPTLKEEAVVFAETLLHIFQQTARSQIWSRLTTGIILLINQRDATLCSLIYSLLRFTVHVSGAPCTHHQEYN
jgi:hypothetical protein